jgi:alkylation response protein AidB-like acyl-CoA dehydrogenase
MDINLEDDQIELGKVIRRFFATRYPISAIRELETSAEGFSADVWHEMAALDWLGLGFPEESGGSGGSMLELIVLYQELGRSLAPAPHLESAVICGGALHAAGTTAARDVLTKIWTGESIVTPAITEADGALGSESIDLSAVGSPDGGFRLDGEKLLVAYANSASQLLVAARTGSAEPGRSGITLLLVPTVSFGITLTRLPNSAGFPLYAVTFSGVHVTADAVIGPIGSGWELLSPILDKAAVLRAAQIHGAAERLLEYAVDYSQQRSQFGKPIGQYQAVQYLCSDIAINAHLTGLHTRYAAGVIDAGLPAAKAVSEAKTQANLTARLAPERTHAVHAGIAFMLDFDVQLYTRRCRHWELDLGDDRYHRERIARELEIAGAPA